MGRFVIILASVPLHHFPQRWSGSDGAGLQLVAWTQINYLAEAIEVWPGIPGQSRSSRRVNRARDQQERNANHGWNPDRDGNGLDRLALGTVEHARASYLAVGDGF